MDWVTETHYNVGDRVFVFREWFTCLVEHESNIFANDFFDNKYWDREELREKQSSV